MQHLTKWLIRSWPMLLLMSVQLQAQELTLTEVQAMARQNFPLIKQKELISRTAGLNVSNISKGFLPQLSVNGQASYQSDVTQVKVPIAGINIEAPEKDQYKLTAEFSQLIYDGGLNAHQKSLQKLTAAVEDQQVEVELYKLKARVNDLYLGILYTDEQIKQVQLVTQDIDAGLKKVEAQVNNGVAYRSSLNILKAEMIKAGQRLIEVRATRMELMDMLALFTGKPLSATTVLVRPVSPATLVTAITRPEIGLYDSRSKLLEHQQNLIRAKNLPKANLFFQGGYGRPGLNLLKNEFDLFYIGGIRLNWSLGGLYTKKNDLELVRLQRDMVKTQQETFELNTNADIKKQAGEIGKLQQLIGSDREIITLRKSVTDAAKAQLENGVMTASDYLREVNAEDQARQALITHELQLLQAQINFQTITGK